MTETTGTRTSMAVSTGYSRLIRPRRWRTPALAAVVFAALLAGCSRSPSSGTGQTVPATNANDNSGSGYGDFSFDLSNQNAGTNGVEDGGPDAEAGAALYRSAEQACAVCHGTDAEGTTALGSPLAGTTTDRLLEVLAEDSDHTGGPRPDFANDDYLNLAAFLATVGQDVSTNGTDVGTNGTEVGTNGTDTGTNG